MNSLYIAANFSCSTCAFSIEQWDTWKLLFRFYITISLATARLPLYGWSHTSLPPYMIKMTSCSIMSFDYREVDCWSCHLFLIVWLHWNCSDFAASRYANCQWRESTLSPYWMTKQGNNHWNGKDIKTHNITDGIKGPHAPFNVPINKCFCSQQKAAYFVVNSSCIVCWYYWGNFAPFMRR